MIGSVGRGPVGIGGNEKLGNGPVGSGGNEKEPVGRGILEGHAVGNEKGPVGRGMLDGQAVGNGNGPVGRGMLDGQPVGRGIPDGQPIGNETVGRGILAVLGTERLGKVVARVGIMTLPFGRVVGGNGRTGIVVGSVNGGRVEVDCSVE